MEKVKNYISSHKLEIGLIIFGSSLAAYCFLKKKKVDFDFCLNSNFQQPMSSILIVPTQQRLEYSNNFLQNIKKTPMDSEEDFCVINSIEVIDKERVDMLASQLTEKSYINVQYIVDLLEKSKVELVYDILYSQSTTSTQTISYKYFEDYNNPFIYITDTQTRGRGKPSF